MWAALIVAVAFATRGPRSLRRSVLLAILAGVSAPLFAAVLYQLNDVSGISFAVFMMSPILIAALLQEEIAAVIVSSIATLVVGAGMFQMLPGSSGSRGEWALASLTAGALAVHSSILRRRAWTNTVALEAERVRNATDHARAARAALIGQVASGLAHEINNPLAVMTANLRLLEEATRDAGAVDGEVAGAFAESQAAAERIAAVVRRIESLATPDADELESCDVCATAREELARVALPSNVQLVDEMPAAMPAVAFSRVEVLRIVGQIVAGTLEALAGGSSSAAPRIALGARVSEGRAELTLDDNGRIARARPTDEALSFGSRGADSGLGLVLLRELLRRRGGDVSVEPAAGGGERVTVRLPLDLRAPPHAV